MDSILKVDFFPFRAYKLGELLNLFDGVDCSSAYTIAVTNRFIPNFITQCSPRPHRGTVEKFPSTLFGDFGELLVYFILKCNGYSVTKPTPDHGVDFLAENGTERLAIQVKFRSNTEHEFDLVSDNIEGFIEECKTNYKKKDGWRKIVITNTNSRLKKRDITWYGSEFINEQMSERWSDFFVFFKSLC